MAEKPKETERSRTLKESEQVIAISGPAILANRVMLLVMESGMRITFAEQRSSESDPLFRSAVILPISTAIGLRDALTRLLSKVEDGLTVIDSVEEEENDAE